MNIYTELDELTDQTHLVAKVEKLKVEDIAPFLFSTPSIKGMLTGTAMIRNPFGKTQSVSLEY